MTIKTTEIVSVTIPEWNLLNKTFELLSSIATSTDTPIGRQARDAADSLALVMYDIEEICGC